MIKKILLAGLLVGFTGLLVWGGVNRTLAKTRNTEVTNGRGEGQNQSKFEDHQENYPLEAEAQHIDSDELAEFQGSNGNGLAAESSQGANTNTEGNQGKGNRGSGNAGRGQGGGQGSQPLDNDEILALKMALDDEYHALAVYTSVVKTFGEVVPFPEIIQSEQRHIESLVKHFDNHGIPIPENIWMGEIPPFESIAAACQAGADAEIANASLYNQLFSMTDDPGLTQVFTNLSYASLESHLPQFEACK